MMIRLSAALLTLVLLAAAPPATLDMATKTALLAGADRALGGYAFDQKIAAAKAALQNNRERYLAIVDPQAFADAVTGDLYAATHDKHLSLLYFHHPLPKAQKPTAADLAQETQREAEDAFGFTRILRLAGNIGYLHIDGFASMPGARHTIDATMTLLAHTDALIVDLRDNQGGDPDSLDYLMGYFFPKRTELTNIMFKNHGKFERTRQYSASHVGGPYYAKPIYVLTSDRTISAGEQFAYDLQALHRATLVGKTTAGGANPGDVVPLSAYFGLFVPQGYAENPYTHKNWEGTGVVPDVAIDTSAALLEAYTRALRANTMPSAESAEARKDPSAALKTSLPQR